MRAVVEGIDALDDRLRAAFEQFKELLVAVLAQHFVERLLGPVIAEFGAKYWSWVS